MAQEMKLLVVLFAFLTLISYGNTYWCTRSKSEVITQEVTEIHKCNKTYESSCAFFSWSKCTFSELVDCPVKKNISITRYFIVEECCPGLKLDPVNNITCISISESTTATNMGVTTPGVKQTISPTTTSVVGDGDDEDGKNSMEDSDDLLFGLSQGAYAGIICSMLFFLCVFVLIMLHIRKKALKAKAKENLSNSVEMETKQKMLSVPA